MRKVIPAHLRFERYVDRTVKHKDGCVVWKGSAGRNGYGQFSLNGKTMHASRAVYIMVNGAIPKGLYVCHTCDNKRCVNIDHLFLGTPKNNSDDMVAKGRNTNKLSGRPTHRHASTIKALGGSTALGRTLGGFTAQRVDRWRTHGIPVKFWPRIAKLCAERKLRVPVDIKRFLA
jgi:hypothetical protein